MSLLGGVLYRDPGRPVERGVLRAMAARVPGAGDPLVAGDGAAGLFVTGAPSQLRTGESLLAVADLDLLEAPGAGGDEGAGGNRLSAGAPQGLDGMRPEELHGAFAVAVWDGSRRRLRLAVDRFGIKRLFYAMTPEGLAFASRPAALLAFAGVGSGADPTSIYHYLNFGFIPAPHSIVPAIRRLPPGHVLDVEGGEARLRAYWDLGYPERPLRAGEAAEATVRLVEAAVARALGDARPKEAGSFLSGGTDSSTIVGMLGKVTGERVNAFSIGFQEARYNELAHAELAARHFGATHYTTIITPDAALETLPRLVTAYDEPFGNNSAIGTLLCAQLARDCGVRRLLAGDGGDEIFGGNERYRAHAILARYHRLPGVLRRAFLEPALRGLPPLGVIGRARRYVRRASLPNPRRFYSYGFLFAQDAHALLDPGFAGTVDREAPWALIQTYFDRVQATSELNRLMYLDMKLTIGDNDLLKVTRTAEMAGVGVRFPMLDPALVEFTAAWPARFKVRGLEKRHLFKRAFGTLLPRETILKQKHGFGVPTSEWLRSHPGFRSLLRDTLLSPRARQRGYLRPGAVERLLEQHEADATPYYGDVLWTLLMLELWQQRHLDGG